MYSEYSGKFPATTNSFFHNYHRAYKSGATFDDINTIESRTRLDCSLMSESARLALSRSKEKKKYKRNEHHPFRSRHSIDLI